MESCSHAAHVQGNHLAGPFSGSMGAGNTTSNERKFATCLIALHILHILDNSNMFKSHITLIILIRWVPTSSAWRRCHQIGRGTAAKHLSSARSFVKCHTFYAGTPRTRERSTFTMPAAYEELMKSWWWTWFCDILSCHDVDKFYSCSRTSDVCLVLCMSSWTNSVLSHFFGRP